MKKTTIEWRDIRDEEPNEGDRVYYLTRHGMDIGDVIGRHIADFECHHCFDHDVLFWAPYDEEDLPKRDEVIESLQAIVPGNWEYDDSHYDHWFTSGLLEIRIGHSDSTISYDGFIVHRVDSANYTRNWQAATLKRLLTSFQERQGRAGSALVVIQGLRK